MRFCFDTVLDRLRNCFSQPGLILGSAICCLLFLALDAGAQTAPQKINVSMSSTGMPSIQLFIAREKGFFREEGFDPQLIRMSANAAIAAGVAGELDALGSVGSAVRGIMRGVPLRVVSVDLRRPIFWLVSRPEFRNAKELKGKTLGIATINGSQHSAARKMLAIHGVDADKDLTFAQVGDEATQMQALISNSIQVAGLTPPYVFLARDKFKMNVLESSIDKFASIQQGIGVQTKFVQESPDWLRRLVARQSQVGALLPRQRERNRGNPRAGMESRFGDGHANGTGAANRRLRRRGFPPTTRSRSFSPRRRWR